eukprot:GFUD01040091.1.p1 GENE.GFUD01040091.1~~GFUD01040091.1.p1  ORF type:complete len:518 (+),score=92.69 GFUD01040091.1:99-1652(+)
MSGQDDLSTNLLKKDHENSQSTFNNYNKTKPVDVSSHVKRLFLDSKCSSATIFFRLHLSAHSYFHSPTPWNPGSNSNIPRKVAKLLDSFRPGSSSYSPFQNKADVNNNIEDSDTNEDAANVSEREFNLLRPSEISQRGSENATAIPSIVVDLDNAQPNTHVTSTSEPRVDEKNPRTNENSLSEVISPAEENRRRLYLNFGRPRPFYRVSSTSESLAQEKTTQPTNGNKKRNVLSLQEEARNQIVRNFGLKNLSNIFKNAKDSPKLPPIIKNFLFTFPCQDFEEVGTQRPSKSASYNVRCNLDGQNYTAIFGISEVDKTVSNLWEEEKDWLRLTDPGVTQILAIAVDPLTENIFYIIPERGHVLTEVINTCSDVIDMGDGELRKRQDMVEIIGNSVIETLKRLSQKGLSYGPLKEENIFLCHGQVLLENQLMVKPTSPCNCTDVDHPSGFYASENLRNLHKLGLILARLLNCDGKTPVGQAGCGGLEETLVEENLENVEHSVGKLVRRLLTAPQNFVH